MKLKRKAILLGVFAEFGCWVVLFCAGLLIAFFLDYFALTIIPTDEAQIDKLFYSLPIMILGQIIGFVSGCIGGWVTAHLAEQDEKRHAIYAGWATLCLNFVVAVTLELDSPTPEAYWHREFVSNILLALMIIPSYILGAYLYVRCNGSTKKELPGNQPPIPEP